MRYELKTLLTASAQYITQIGPDSINRPSEEDFKKFNSYLAQVYERKDLEDLREFINPNYNIPIDDLPQIRQRIVTIATVFIHAIDSPNHKFEAQPPHDNIQRAAVTLGSITRQRLSEHGIRYN